jgi:hypothetical protein
MGFSKDEPLRGGAEEAPAAAVAGSAEEGIDNCCWLVDESILGHVWRRCAHLLPASVDGSGAAAGVNARWRLFRYAPGAVYRAHIDGAWPGSGLGADGRYLYDAYRDRSSKLTFLLYLNGEEGEHEEGGFAGGQTVFYTVGGNGKEHALEARGVAPRCGCVLVFPHGDTPSSLVHEGSAVLRGLKYVARTEVLYLQAKKEALLFSTSGV